MISSGFYSIITKYGNQINMLNPKQHCHNATRGEVPTRCKSHWWTVAHQPSDAVQFAPPYLCLNKRSALKTSIQSSQWSSESYSKQWVSESVKQWVSEAASRTPSPIAVLGAVSLPNHPSAPSGCAHVIVHRCMEEITIFRDGPRESGRHLHHIQ